jgi:hypothetical protein
LDFVLVETSSFLYRGKGERTQDWNPGLGITSSAKSFIESIFKKWMEIFNFTFYLKTFHREDSDFGKTKKR